MRAWGYGWDLSAGITFLLWKTRRMEKSRQECRKFRPSIPSSKHSLTLLPGNKYHRAPGLECLSGLDPGEDASISRYRLINEKVAPPLTSNSSRTKSGGPTMLS